MSSDEEKWEAAAAAMRTVRDRVIKLSDENAKLRSTIDTLVLAGEKFMNGEMSVGNFETVLKEAKYGNE